ncbi:50S ribosomal protein L13 [Patescibacteria group bacterium]
MATEKGKRATRELDATDRSIGRLATEIATILQGKDKPTYSAHTDIGDKVEVRNAAKVKITGNKLEDKTYYKYSGHPGGLKSKQLKTVMANDPSDAVRRAVKNMLPKNRLQNERMKRLTVHNE